MIPQNNDPGFEVWCNNFSKNLSLVSPESTLISLISIVTCSFRQSGSATHHFFIVLELNLKLDKNIIKEHTLK